MAYERFLQDRVDREELKPQSMGVNMNHASRLFEVCLRSLTPEALEAMAKAWFPGLGYTKVIAELVSERPREVRRVKS